MCCEHSLLRHESPLSGILREKETALRDRMNLPDTSVRMKVRLQELSAGAGGGLICESEGHAWGHQETCWRLCGRNPGVPRGYSVTQLALEPASPGAGRHSQITWRFQALARCRQVG